MRAGIVGRAGLVAGALLFGALVPSCDDGGGTVTGIVATFTPATAVPSALHVTMQPGSVSGQNFNLKIMATDVSDFFGAAFTIQLPTAVSFASMDTAQSFLRDDAFPVENLSFLADNATPNTLRVVATRLNAGTYSGVNVVGTRELVTLRLRVVTVLPATAIDFAATPEPEVRNSLQPPPEGGLIVVTWSGGSVAATQ